MLKVYSSACNYHMHVTFNWLMQILQVHRLRKIAYLSSKPSTTFTVRLLVSFNMLKLLIHYLINIIKVWKIVTNLWVVCGAEIKSWRITLISILLCFLYKSCNHDEQIQNFLIFIWKNGTDIYFRYTYG